MKNKTDLDVSNREDILLYVKRILHEVLKGKNCDIYLFGSWARKEEKRTSDIDIAIDSNNNIPEHTYAELRDLLEESYLPYRVDIVDLAKASNTIKNKVQKEGILWND